VFAPPEIEPTHSTASKHSGVAVVCLIAAVGLAFADASVVALALPALYGEFDTSIVGVSWVLTTYAVAVAVVAVPIAVLHRRVRPLSLVVAGTVTFTAASLVAGSATSLSMLLAARAVQGAGAAMLLAGSLPVLTAIVPGDGEPSEFPRAPRMGRGRARRWWALAGAVGAAIGPALGGVLTQLFNWRAIFFVQAPIVAAALVVVADPAARALRREGHVHGRASTRRRDVIIANIGFALVFAALVAALFLGVLLAIEVWRYSPIESALIVSALPIGMAIGRRFQAAPGIDVALGGALALALGLAALAMMPGARPVMAAIAFAVCGAGFDLLHEVLDGAAVPADGPAVRASAVSIGARHAGLVLGLALIAPVLSSSIDHGIDRATLGATRTMLTTDLQLSDKIPVTWALRTSIEGAPRGQVPDIGHEFDARGAKDGNSMARARDALLDNITDSITRSFRPAFAIAAGLAALAGIPALLVAGRARRSERSWSERRRRASTVGIAAVAVAAIGLLGWQLAAGARTVGEFVAEDPCTAGPDPHPGSGLDASIQRIALSTLNGAACELHTTRERLVLSLDTTSGYHDVTWDKPTLEKALRVGAHRAINDANDRDSIPGFMAAALGFLVDRAPIDWLVNRIPIGG
jgi:MFS family permease